MSASSVEAPIDIPVAAAQSAARRALALIGLVARRAWVGLRYALGAACGLWVGDVLVMLAGRGGASWAQWATGLGAALFVSASAGAVVGAFAGPVLVPIVERAAASVRAWALRLREQGSAAGRVLAGQAVAAIALAALASLVAHRLVVAVLFGVARADTTELALTGSHLVLAVVLVCSWPVAFRTARAVVGAAGRVPGVRWLLDRVWRVVVASVLPVLVAAGIGAFIYRTELAALPWLAFAPLALIVPGALVTRDLPRLHPPWGRRLTRVGLCLLALVLAASVFAAVRLRPESATEQVLAFDRAWSGRWAYAVWTLALDVDRDGQINVLGGGDCAPFDPRRHAGAPEVPGNGVDEDCDGADLSATTLRPRFAPFVSPAAFPSRPTIVFVTVDALAAPRLQPLGHPVSLMPNVDALAERSMLFTHCFSQGPSTRLSFPSMFTSRWDSQLVFSFAPRLPYSLGPKEKQLQDLADDAGYDTVAVIPEEYFSRGTWPSITRGFQRVDDSALPSGKHDAEQVTDAALRALSADRDRPLYLWVHYYDAHPPYAKLPGVAYQSTDDESLYDAELAHVDAQVGRLADAIAHRSDPTYLILTADHATVFHPNPESRHFHYGYDLYTATLHVPLVVNGPGIAPGRADGLVSTMDVGPTILALMRAKALPDAQGTSLLPELFSGAHDPRRVLFHEFYLPELVLRGRDPLQMVSIRDGRYNLVLSRERGTYELYDWTADYYEQHDLYAGLAKTQEGGRLRSLLGSFVAQFDNRPDTDALAPGSSASDSSPR
jgi:arylsulfatase A-like enzyme